MIKNIFFDADIEMKSIKVLTSDLEVIESEILSENAPIDTVVLHFNSPGGVTYYMQKALRFWNYLAGRYKKIKWQIHGGNHFSSCAFDFFIMAKGEKFIFSYTFSTIHHVSCNIGTRDAYTNNNNPFRDALQQSKKERKEYAKWLVKIGLKKSLIKKLDTQSEIFVYAPTIKKITGATILKNYAL